MDKKKKDYLNENEEIAKKQWQKPIVEELGTASTEGAGGFGGDIGTSSS